MTTDSQKEIDETVTKAMQAWNVPGLALVIVKDNSLPYMQPELHKLSRRRPRRRFTSKSCAEDGATSNLIFYSNSGARVQEDELMDCP